MTKEARRTWVVFDGGFKFHGLLPEHERVTQALQGVSDSLLDRVLVLKSPAAYQCRHTQRISVITHIAFKLFRLSHGNRNAAAAFEAPLRAQRPSLHSSGRV